MPFVPVTTYGRATLGANSAANKLLLAVLFSDPYFGIQFLKDVALIPTSMVSWCVDTIPPAIRSVSFMCLLGHTRIRSRADGGM
jgi:hypothetical protein